MMNHYKNTIEKLYQLESVGIKLGLKNVLKLSSLLNHPWKNFQSIHVAGTNGKGSVCYKIAKALSLEGFSVGLYTSPHLFCFTERIQINEIPIKKNDLIKHIETLFSLCSSHKIKATFFEITTLTAFLYFAQKNVDFAVIETGLGGRLDATNIIFPSLSIITSISKDHTQILGNSLLAITKEKAGIIKKDTPVIIGPSVPLNIIQPIAKRLNAPLIHLETKAITPEQENRLIAKRALLLLNIHPTNIDKALQTTPCCRYEIIDVPPFKKVVLDVAHNKSAIFSLFSRIKKDFPCDHIYTICAFSKDKETKNCLETILTYSQHVYLTNSSHPRIAHPKSYFFPNKKVSICSTVVEAIENVKNIKKSSIVVFCGSFFIMKDVYEYLNLTKKD